LALANSPAFPTILGMAAQENEGPQYNCKLCGTATPNLNPVPSGLRLGMQKEGMTEPPTEICTKCLRDWRKKISKGVQISAQQEVKKNHKTDLWRNRLKFVKQARSLFTNKLYQEAALSYEKYLKVLAIVHDMKGKTLEPALFKDNPKEITLICSVYWDLMLIYDADPKLFEKQAKIGESLAEFAKYSPILSTLIRKADIERRRGKNRQVYKDFMKACGAKVSRCFIASAAFSSHYDPTVKTLCLFREQALRPNPLGRLVIRWYYSFSPSVADKLDRSPWARQLCRIALRPLAFVLKLTFRLQE